MEVSTYSRYVCRVKNCQVLDDRHILRESDIAADNQGKDVYFLLKLDGSLPFTGTLGKNLQHHHPTP